MIQKKINRTISLIFLIKCCNSYLIAMDRPYVTVSNGETIAISDTDYKSLVEESRVLKKMMPLASDTTHDLPLPLLDKRDFELVQTYLSLEKQSDKKEFLALINPHQRERLLESADKLNIKSLLSLARQNVYSLLTKKAYFESLDISWKNTAVNNAIYAINGSKNLLAMGIKDGSIYFTRPPESKLISIETYDPNVNKLRIVDQAAPKKIAQEATKPTAMRFSSNGAFFGYLVSNKIYIRKIKEEVFSKFGDITFEYEPTNFCFNDDGSIIAASNPDGSLEIISNSPDLIKTPIKKIKMNNKITSLAFNSNSMLLAVGCDDGTLSLFDFKNNETKQYESNTKNSITEMAFDSKKNMLAFCQKNSNFITIFNTSKGKITKKIYLDFIPNHLTFYSKHPLLVAGGSGSNDIIFCDVDLQKIILTLNRDQKTKALSLTRFDRKLLTQNSMWDVSKLPFISYFVKNCSIPELAFINDVYYATEKKQKIALTPHDLKPVYDNLYKPIQDLIADEVTFPTTKK